MARRVDGVSTIFYATRIICRMVGRFGSYRVGTRLSPEFELAVVALVAACHAFEALDDHPFEVDETPGTGPEDLPPAEG